MILIRAELKIDNREVEMAKGWGDRGMIYLISTSKKRRYSDGLFYIHSFIIAKCSTYSRMDINTNCLKALSSLTINDAVYDNFFSYQ